ncbi:unnamed protein product [Spirodela intermedia]|uniref:C2 NT-type domain-containing protein n=1 Tax=Spirodela intermedia TaxID=51605 RepID=A0A7I8IEV0_SPIIN|nr:unnamed protein product [Spirodela intermedia]CAA6655623.1 unnamed protein product [Spirodela intermedia]
MEEREEQDQGRVQAAVPGDPGTFSFDGEDDFPLHPRLISARIRSRGSRSRRCEDVKNPSGLSRDSQVPPSKWENLVITLIPVDVGKPTAKSEKAAVSSGACQWEKPIYETVKFVREPKTGRINEKVYHILVSATGFPKAALLGEATIDFAGYVEAIKPSSVSLPLKASDSNALLHVTIQRTQEAVRGRETERNGETMAKPQRKTLMSQLSNSDVVEDPENARDINGFANAEKPSANGERMRFPSARAVVQDLEFNADLRTSRSFDAVSASWSDTSSGRYTPGDSTHRSTIFRQDSTSLLSPLGNTETPPRPMLSPTDYGDDRRSNVEWAASSAPNGSGEEGTGHSDESFRELKNELVALARQVEVSELELQALRKQVVKERKLVVDLSKDLNSTREERDKFRRECDELMASEEVRQELDHEKSLNANLCLQLKKMQDSNSELMLAIRDLDEMLDQKNRETSNGGCERVLDDPARDGGRHEKKHENGFSYVRRSECNGRSCKPQYVEEEEEEEEDDEQYALEALVKEREIKMALSLEQKIVELNNEIEMHRKDREELEMQMEQIALDYEILKQENHDISSKLEQIQLREQLRMQYECSAHVSIINELEGQVEKLETELEKQAEAFEADLTVLTSAKVEQEKRAIQLEEALRKAKQKNVKIAECLMEELQRLSIQMSSMFGKNEKLTVQALAEAGQLRLRNSQLEELLKKVNQGALSVKDRHRSQIEDFESEVDLSKGRIEQLDVKLRQKSEELEKEKRSKAEQNVAFTEEIIKLKTRIESLENEKNDIYGQVKRRDDSGDRVKQSNESVEGTGRLLPNGNIKGEVIQRECSSTREEAGRLRDELHDPRFEKKEGELITRTLNLEPAALETEKSSLGSLFEKEHQNKTLAIQAEAKPISASSEATRDSPSEIRLTKEVVNTEFGLDDEILLSPNPEGRKFTYATNAMREESIDSKIGFRSKIEEEASNGFPSDQCHLTETLREMATLREVNKSMEAELKEMQERYSEISLKFAQVEGERQQLVMTVRTLKNALKV